MDLSVIESVLTIGPWDVLALVVVASAFVVIFVWATRGVSESHRAEVIRALGASVREIITALADFFRWRRR